MAKIITVKFRTGTILAVERDDGVFVALKPSGNSMGIEWRKQQERLRRDPILVASASLKVAAVPGTDWCQCATQAFLCLARALDGAGLRVADVIGGAA